MCSNKEELQKYSYSEMKISTDFKEALEIIDKIKIVANIEMQEFYVYPEKANLKDCITLNFYSDNHFTVPVRVTRYVDLDRDYYISTIFDEENNRIICRQSDVKYRKAIITMSDRERYVLHERQKGKKYKDIAKEINVGLNRARQIYVRAKQKATILNIQIENQD